MNKTLFAIASLCAFSLSACQSAGTNAAEFTQTYRLHTPDGVIETSDPKIIAAYRTDPDSTIVPLGDARPLSTQMASTKTKPAAP